MADVLDWCAEAGAAAIPYGGGSSVVGGVEDVGDTYRGAVTVDLRHLDQVLDIDRASRAARIQAGVFGPASRTSCVRTASRCVTSRSRSSSRRSAVGSRPIRGHCHPGRTSTTSWSRCAS